MSCKIFVEEDETYVLEWETQDIEEIIRICNPHTITSLIIKSKLIDYQFTLKLLNCTCFSDVTELILHSVFSQGIKALQDSTLAWQLTKLGLQYEGILSERITVLAQSDKFSQLNTLDLSQNKIDVEEAKAFGQSLILKQLTTFNLSHNRIGDEGAKILAQSPNFKQLTTFDLSHNNIGDAGAKILAQSPNFKQLITLNLQQNCIGDAGAEALAQSDKLIRLTKLDLTHNRIGDLGATALALSDKLAQLPTLDLSINNIGDAGATALAQSNKLIQLTRLDLSDNRIGDSGATALAQSDKLIQLTRLDLSGNGIGDAGATALAQSNKLTQLTTLDLSNNNIGDAGALTLVLSDNLTQLSKLDLGCESSINAKFSWISTRLRGKRKNFSSNHRRNLYPKNSEITAPQSIRMNLQALRDYYTQLDVLQTIPIKVMKTFLIGEPNAGKSTLFHALMGKKLKLGRLARTQGFEKGQITINNVYNDQFDGKIDITLNLWDMGGQSIQQMIHSLFFRSRAIYLYLANSVHQAKAGKHWIDSIVEGRQDVWLMSVANPHLSINAPDLNKALRAQQNSFVDKCHAMGVKRLYICSGKDEGDTSGIINSLREEITALPLPFYLKPYVQIAEQFIRPPKPFYRQTEFCTYLETQPYINAIWQGIEKKLTTQGKTISEDGFYHNLVYYLDDLGVVAYLPQKTQNKRTTNTFETAPDGWVITDPVFIQKGLYTLLPPEDKSAPENDEAQILLKKLKTKDEVTGLVGIFSKEDLLPVINKWFQGENQSKRINTSRVCTDLIEILSHRQLAVVMKLVDNRYFVPAYIENSTNISAVEQITRLLDTYNHSHFTYIFKRNISWPKYFLARFAVFLTNEKQSQRNFIIKPQTISHNHITIETQNKAITIELFQSGKQIWWLSKVKSDSQTHLTSQIMHTLFDLIKEQLMMFNEYRTHDLQRLIPCPMCMKSTKILVETGAAPENLDDIGLYNYDEILLDNYNTVFACQPAHNYASHNLNKELIMSATNCEIKHSPVKGIASDNNPKSVSSKAEFNIDFTRLSEIDKRIIKGNFDEKKDRDDVSLACHIALSRIFKLLLSKEYGIVKKNSEFRGGDYKKHKFITDSNDDFRDKHTLYSKNIVTVLGLGNETFTDYIDEVNVMLVKLIGIDGYSAASKKIDIDIKLMTKQIVYLRHLIETRGMVKTAEQIKKYSKS